MVKDWSDEDVWWKLKRIGHDYHKVYAAYKAAMEHTGQPTVILAKTIKGYGLGSHFAGRNATHQMKKLTLDDLKGLRDSLKLPISDERSRPTRTARRTSTRARTTRRSSTPRSAPEAGRLPAVAPGRPQAARVAAAQGLRGGEEGHRQAAGRHDHGVRPAAQGPHARQGVRQARGADHPRRGPHVRHGLVHRRSRSTTRTGSTTRRSTPS